MGNHKTLSFLSILVFVYIFFLGSISTSYAAVPPPISFDCSTPGNTGKADLYNSMVATCNAEGTKVTFAWTAVTDAQIHIIRVDKNPSLNDWYNGAKGDKWIERNISEITPATYDIEKNVPYTFGIQGKKIVGGVRGCQSAQKGFRCVPVCEGKNTIYAPRPNTPLVVGNTYTVSGWSYFCFGPQGRKPGITDLHICDQGTPNVNCLGIQGNVPRYSKKEVANFCGKDLPTTVNSAGWTYDWVVPTAAVGTNGRRKILAPAINAPNLPSTPVDLRCVDWKQVDVVVITPTPTPVVSVKHTVTGRVVDAGNVGVKNVLINVYENKLAKKRKVITVRTDNNGYYVVSKLLNGKFIFELVQNKRIFTNIAPTPTPIEKELVQANPVVSIPSFSVVLVPTPTRAAVHIIRGTVLYSGSAKPVGKAQVKLYKNGYNRIGQATKSSFKSTTDKDGKYSFSKLPNGKYEIDLSKNKNFTNPSGSIQRELVQIDADITVNFTVNAVPTPTPRT